MANIVRNVEKQKHKMRVPPVTTFPPFTTFALEFIVDGAPLLMIGTGLDSEKKLINFLNLFFVNSIKVTVTFRRLFDKSVTYNINSSFESFLYLNFKK